MLVTAWSRHLDRPRTSIDHCYRQHTELGTPDIQHSCRQPPRSYRRYTKLGTPTSGRAAGNLQEGHRTQVKTAGTMALSAGTPLCVHVQAQCRTAKSRRQTAAACCASLPSCISGSKHFACRCTCTCTLLRVHSSLSTVAHRAWRPCAMRGHCDCNYAAMHPTAPTNC